MPEAEGERLSLLNGFCTSEQPLTRSENGVIFGSLAAAAKAYPELVERYYNQLAESQGDAVSALNTVFAQDGAFVYVPQGVRAERPFVISITTCARLPDSKTNRLRANPANDSPSL